jgi:hypothetical protein
VIVGLVALVVVAGAVIGAVALGSGFGSARAGGGLRAADVEPAALASLVVPPALPATAPPAGHSYSGPLVAGLPPDLTAALPSPRMTGLGEQSLADDMSKIVGYWVAAWAIGNVANPQYAGFCIMECRFFLDETVTLWSRAGIRPAGMLRVYNLTGNTSYGGYNGVAVVCIDDGALYAVSSSGHSGSDPFHAGEPLLYVFSGVYDIAVNHWIMTAAEVFPGDAYCGRSGTPNAPAR